MDILEDFQWHSSIGLDEIIVAKKKKVKHIKASSKVMAGFMRVGTDGDYLIHKATKALWKFSKDGSSIEPVFEEDILVEEDLK